MKTINDKSIVDDKVRMTEPSLIFIKGTQVIAEHEVTEDEICRIDLISLEYYNDADFVDYILKFNGISNPFAIDTGDVLLIPNNISVATKFLPFKVINANEDKLSIRDQFINTKRLSQKDAKRIEYLQRKANLKINGSSEVLPPNIRKSDDEPNIKIGNGRIVI